MYIVLFEVQYVFFVSNHGTLRPITDNSPLTFHSDRGIQYAYREFVKELSYHKSVTRSMSGKGNCCDNAVAESFFKTLKVELIYRNRFRNKHEADLAISEYIEKFYNTNRRHKHLDNLNIFEYRQLVSGKLKRLFFLKYLKYFANYTPEINLTFLSKV